MNGTPKFTRRVGITLGLALGASMMAANVAQAGIADTKHNLGSTNSTVSGGQGGNTYSATEAICVFCHTPHGADTSAEVPLWNRTLPEAITFTTYDSLGTTTLDGAVAAVGSVSIACLSCHDGTQAMNVMINTPGSGTDPLTGTWTGPASSATPVGSLGYSSIVNIGTDLTNDHPVGIQYAGGGLSSGDADGATGTASFADAGFFGAYKATINGNPVWWVDTGTTGTGTREKGDMQLYTRSVFDDGTGTGTNVTEPFVECASCHNPHESANPTFLRIANTGSAVCLACHDK